MAPVRRDRFKKVAVVLGSAVGALGVGSAAMADVVGDPFGLVSIGLFGSSTNNAQVAVAIGGGDANTERVDNTSAPLALAVGGGNANGGIVSAAVLGGSANGYWATTLVALALLGGNADGNTTSMLAFSDSGCASSGWGLYVGLAVSLADGCGATSQRAAVGLRGADAHGPIAVSDTGAATGSCTTPSYTCLTNTGTGISVGGPASGGIAVSGMQGANAWGTAGSPLLAVSGLGAAQGPIAVAGTGNATSTTWSFVPGVAVSGTGCSDAAEVAVGGNCANGGLVAVGGTGDANSGLVAVSGTGNATAPVAVDLE